MILTSCSAHFHLVMGVAAIFGMFAGVYFWFPKMFGRMMSEKLGNIHFWPTFIGVYTIFIPMHAMGIVGMPRRYSSFAEYAFLNKTHPLVLLVTIAVIITASVQFLFLFNFFWTHVQRQEGQRQSVGSDDARMGDRDAAAARQLRRQTADGLSRRV